jgi:beta-glucosidase
VTAALGDLVGLAGVFNEPNIGLALRQVLPPGLYSQFPALMREAAQACGSPRFSTVQFANQDLARPNLIAAYEKAYGVIKGGPGKFPVGLSLAIFDDQAVGEGSVRDQMRAELYEPWLDAVRRTGDFIGVQTYSRVRWDRNGKMEPPPGARLTQMHEEFYPEALENTIRYAHARTGKPVYVTENGVSTDDDRERIEYIQRALRGVRNCLDSGVPVRSYIHWSLLDNFEWVSGYGPKFGLVAVNRATQTRTPKPSAAMLGALAKSRRLA